MVQIHSCKAYHVISISWQEPRMHMNMGVVYAISPRGETGSILVTIREKDVNFYPVSGCVHDSTVSTRTPTCVFLSSSDDRPRSSLSFSMLPHLLIPFMDQVTTSIQDPFRLPIHIQLSRTIPPPHSPILLQLDYTNHFPNGIPTSTNGLPQFFFSTSGVSRVSLRVVILGISESFFPCVADEFDSSGVGVVSSYHDGSFVEVTYEWMHGVRF
mmetsp:Transcript_4369/g.6670  ORF Transcript_4369/g.6670 Transcript_4369/m.6670 type:complete len:213 (+) Transcript_4369:129-767(+)